MLQWITEGNVDTWNELSNIEMEQEEVNSKTCDCGYCRRVNRAMNLELVEMLEATTSDLLPEALLRATSRSARYFPLRSRLRLLTPRLKS